MQEGQIKAVENSNDGNSPSPSKEKEVNDDQESEEESNDQDLSSNINECRIALEKVLVKMKEMEDKVDVLEKRVTEVQLNRSEGNGSVATSILKKRNSCVNDKDSLFKECFEHASGKLKV